MLSSIKYLVTDTFPFVGGAQAEAKITDAVTDQTLALAVDRRIGALLHFLVLGAALFGEKFAAAPLESTRPGGRRFRSGVRGLRIDAES
ncbi:MAG: hypothetical protein ACREXW_15460 [Gammaproteobacteria bacterium]